MKRKYFLDTSKGGFNENNGSTIIFSPSFFRIFIIILFCLLPANANGFFSKSSPPSSSSSPLSSSLENVVDSRLEAVGSEQRKVPDERIEAKRDLVVYDGLDGKVGGAESVRDGRTENVQDAVGRGVETGDARDGGPKGTDDAFGRIRDSTKEEELGKGREPDDWNNKRHGNKEGHDDETKLNLNDNSNKGNSNDKVIGKVNVNISPFYDADDVPLPEAMISFFQNKSTKKSSVKRRPHYVSNVTADNGISGYVSSGYAFSGNASSDFGSSGYVKRHASPGKYFPCRRCKDYERVVCKANPCKWAKCDRYPEARCLMTNCGGCFPTFWLTREHCVTTQCPLDKNSGSSLLALRNLGFEEGGRGGDFFYLFTVGGIFSLIYSVHYFWNKR